MLPILMYHKVAEIPPWGRHLGNYVLPEQFEAQLTAISRWGYTATTLEDWLAFRAGRRKPPRRPIALTFDDGYQSNHDIAWPFLHRHSMTATVFLVADLIGGANRWDVNEPQEPLLRPEEIRAMQAAGIQFGSHTCTHGSLIDMQPNEALRELTRSRATLMALLGRPVVTLAYPYNKQNAAVRALARQAGYKAAVLGRGRINARWTNPHALMRIRVDPYTTVEALGHRLTRLRWLAGV
ncbi:MAG: polysaccharide deacetylase family protein [Candidatus Acidiferrales bacterium]